MYPSDGPGMAFPWQDACRCPVLTLVEARNICDGIVPNSARWGLHDVPFSEAAIAGKRIAASRCVRKNNSR